MYSEFMGFLMYYAIPTYSCIDSFLYHLCILSSKSMFKLHLQLISLYLHEYVRISSNSSIKVLPDILRILKNVLFNTGSEGVFAVNLRYQVVLATHSVLQKSEIILIHLKKTKVDRSGKTYKRNWYLQVSNLRPHKQGKTKLFTTAYSA